MLTMADFEEQESNIEEFDSEFDAIISQILESQHDAVHLPDDLHVDMILQNIKFKNPITPIMKNINQILKTIDWQKYIQFCKSEFTKLSTFIEELNVDPPKPVPEKSLIDFYRKVHQYNTGPEYCMNCLLWFENESFTDSHSIICYDVSVEIRKYLLKKKSELYPVGLKKFPGKNLTNFSQARIRYVGGNCIARVRHIYMQKKKSYMYKVQPSDQAMYDESVMAVNILDSLMLDEQFVSTTTTLPHTLLRMRRNTSHGHTHISDDLFLFFQRLTEMCISGLVDENLNEHGGKLFAFLKDNIMSKEDLAKQLSSVAVNSLHGNEDIGPLNEDQRDKQIDVIYQKIVDQFLIVMAILFRKDVLEAFNVSINMADGKQVRDLKAEQTGDKQFKGKGKQLKRNGIAESSDTQSGIKREIIPQRKGKLVSSEESSSEEGMIDEQEFQTSEPVPSTSTHLDGPEDQSKIQGESQVNDSKTETDD